MAFAVIVSRYEGGSWQRSNARLSISNHVMGIPTMQQAIDVLKKIRGGASEC